jgi:hypothetical protein
MNTDQLTISNGFFNENKQITYWQFEVIYKFESETIKSTFNIEINEGPKNGSCMIHPSTGTIDTIFTINCSGWIDHDGIKDYSFYRSIKSSDKFMLGFTNQSIYQLRLPSSIHEKTSLEILVQIQDTLGSLTEFNLSSIIVFTNLSTFLEVQDLMNKSILQLVESDDQNTIEQIVISISNILNELNDLSLAGLFVSSLHDDDLNMTEKIFNSSNDFLLLESNQQLNKHAYIREELIKSIAKLNLSSFNDFKFQSSILTHLTQKTNQLTRKASVILIIFLIETLFFRS